MERLVLQKAAPKSKSPSSSNGVEDEDGVLTRRGMDVAHQYALQWRTKQTRNVELERQYPSLIGLFYDIRNDSDLAAEHAIPFQKSFGSAGNRFQKGAAMRYVIGVDPAIPESEQTSVFLVKSNQRGLLHVMCFDNDQSDARSILRKAPKGVVAIGPKGGKIVGYDSKGKPIYEKEDEAQQTLQLSVVAKTPGRIWVDHKPGMPAQTADKWRLEPPPKDADPVYREERKSLHKRLVDSFFKSPETGNPVKKPGPGEQKVAFVMMGGTASGKTTAVKRLLEVGKGREIEDAGFVNFNPDDVKERMPEYQESVDFEHDGQTVTARDAAFMVHEESSDIAHDVLNKALDEGYNVVVDGTGKNADNHIRTIQKLKRLGYEVRLVMPDVDIEGSDGAAARAIKRAERSGRFVPMGAPPPGTPDILRDIHMQIPANFERVAAECDEFTLFDGRGFPPTVKWQGKKGEPPLVKDEEWVAEFQKRGKELKQKHTEWKAAMKKDKHASAPCVTPLQKGDESEPMTKGPKKFKGAGKVPKANVPWPTNHGANADRIGKRIKYK